jgi:hypothetical protein
LPRGKDPLERYTSSVVYTAGQLLLHEFLISTVAAHVGASGVTHYYARTDDTEDYISEQRLRNWSQTARTVLLWAKFLVTALSTSNLDEGYDELFRGGPECWTNDSDDVPLPTGWSRKRFRKHGWPRQTSRPRRCSTRSRSERGSHA